MQQICISFSLLFLMCITACQEDPCETVDCGPYGSCISLDDEANCRCDDGYEQDASGKCTIFSITQYPGTYTASETCVSKLRGDTTRQDYTLDISLFSTQEINLINLGNQICSTGNLTVQARIDENDFSITEGVYCRDAINETEYMVSGTGSISEDGISFEYELSFSQFGTVTINSGCSVTLSPQ